MKLIGITQRVDFIENRNETRYSLDKNMITFVECCNCLAITIPNNSQFLEEWLDKIKLSGIVLSGGNDIGECLDRDSTEKKLMVYSEKNKIPLLGICRGMQILAIRSGSKLVKIDGHVKKNHHIHGEIEKVVNSFHEYSINSCPNNFRIIAIDSTDKTIEAIRHQSLPWEGWMWHPERENPFHESDKIRFKSLFS